MPGLPFGAAQSYDVPHELRTYEHVQGIEFIEVDPYLPFPRSAAYRKTVDGAQMLIRRGAPEIAQVDLAADEARSLIAALDAAGLFYNKTETWIDSEKLYEVLYSFDMEGM